MTLEQLRIFVEAAKFGNFTVASKSLGMTQAAVSQSIRKLEETHGVVLFDRSSKSQALTSVGELLLTEAVRILNDVALTVRRLENQKDRSNRRLMIACTPNAYNHWMPGIAQRLRGRHPDADFDIICGDADDVTAWVMRGTADAGISEMTPGIPNLRYHGVFRDQLILCEKTPPESRPDETINWSTLADHAPILFETTGGLAKVLNKALDERKIDPRRLIAPNVKLDSGEAVLCAVLAGPDPGFVAQRMSRAHLASQMIKPLGDIRVAVDYWCFALEDKQIEPLASVIARAADSLADS